METVKNKEEKAIFVLEYIEKYTNDNKAIVVKGESKLALDCQTENFETKERLAATYFEWTNAFVEGPKRSLKDMYIVSENSELGKLLDCFELVDTASSHFDLSFYDREINDENGNIKVINLFNEAKELTKKMPIKLMKDRKSVINPDLAYYVDRTPLIQMPKRTKRI